MREPDVAAYDGAAPYHCVAAEYGCPCVNHYVVFERRMAFGVANQFTVRVFVERKRAYGHALIELDVVAKNSCAAYDYARAVIYEEGRANLRARMNVYPCAVMRVLGHDARQKRHSHLVKLVRKTIDHHGVDARIAEDYFVHAIGRRVAIVGRLHVGRKNFAYAREFR